MMTHKPVKILQGNRLPSKLLKMVLEPSYWYGPVNDFLRTVQIFLSSHIKWWFDSLGGKPAGKSFTSAYHLNSHLSYTFWYFLQPAVFQVIKLSVSLLPSSSLFLLPQLSFTPSLPRLLPLPFSSSSIYFTFLCKA